MAEATFRKGNPDTIEHTPAGGNVAEGQVVVVGTVTANTAGEGAITGIAERPITNSTLGELAVGGQWDVTNLNNAANGKKVYWDDTNNKVTTVSTNNAVFGWIVSGGGGGANSIARALHAPYHNVN